MSRWILILCLLVGCQSSEKRKLHLYIWSDAIAPELLKQFEEEQQCHIVIDTYDSNEALYAKLKLGATGYDLVFPSNYLIGLMAEKGLLQPIDFNKVANLKNLDPAYPPFGEYGIPYLVSYVGLGYRQDKVPSFFPSWTIFSEKHLRGRMTMLNDVREALGAALKSLGYSVNTKNRSEIQQAADQLIRWKRNLAKFESEQYKNGIASAEYLVVQGYAGDILQVMRENSAVGFAYPEEGTTYSIDYAALLKSAPEPDLALAFINFLLESESAKINTLFTSYLHPCQPSYALLPKEMQKNQALFPPESVQKRAERIERVGPALPLYTEAWDRVKEG